MTLALGYRMLFRKGGTAASILSVALIVAILASVNSIVNYLGFQAEVLEGFVNVGETYLLLDGNSTAATDSIVDAKLTTSLKNMTCIKYVLPQRMLTASMTTFSGNETVTVRGVDDVGFFLKLRGAYVNGTVAKDVREVDVGEILAKTFSINRGDEINLVLGENLLRVKVVGIFRTQTQSDVEVIVPMKALIHLTGNDTNPSIIEFAFKEDVGGEAVNYVIKLLPKDVRVVKVQQLKKFVYEINAQTLSFLNIWSIAVYAVVAAASYIIAVRLVAESSYELAMLKVLGAKKRLIFTIVLAYTLVVAFTGSVLGISLGTVGAQVASTVFRWVQPRVDVEPFLEVWQALQILMLTLFSSIVGCMYPALKSTRTRYVEQPL
ncbi:MAG: FtsX-like permease family protein [Nitrososphaeria archaeon]